MSAIDDLLVEIFDDKRGPFYRDFESWLRGSRRFQAFATEHRSKIRAKLKNARDVEGIKDLAAELETAALLLTEPSFTLEYEKYAASHQRGPDYTVSFRTHTPFNVEVRRVRGSEFEAKDAAAQTVKLVAILCDKVGQMPPGVFNVLWLTGEGGVGEDRLAGAAILLRELAERRADDFFAHRGFAGAAEFLKQYQRLGAVALRQPAATVWLNPLARHKPSPDIVKTLRRAVSAAYR
jgi:hypothetical protein